MLYLPYLYPVPSSSGIAFALGASLSIKASWLHAYPVFAFGLELYATTAVHRICALPRITSPALPLCTNVQGLR